MLHNILKNMFTFAPVFRKGTKMNVHIIVLIIKEMKKLVLFFAIATVVAFSACTNKAQQTATPATTPADTTVAAPAAPADTTATPAK